MIPLVLSLFPGVDLLGRAFEEAGFCVVCGPDKLWGARIQGWHVPAGAFDGVIGGSPCPAFSSLRHLVIARYGPEKVAPNLIPEFERVVTEAAPRWFLHENAVSSPPPQVPGYAVVDFVLNNRELGGEQCRERRISFGLQRAAAIDLRAFLDYAPLECPDWHPAIMASAGQRPGSPNRPRMSRTTYLAESLRRQGLPADFFAGSPFTAQAQQAMIGNGVPLPMGRALAEAIKRALQAEGIADAA